MVKRRGAPRDPSDANEGGKPEADADAFARAMAGVRRLPPDPRGQRVAARPHASVTRVTAPSLASPDIEDADANVEAAFVAPGVDRRELRKLKRGDYKAGHSIDLHGLTAAEAVASVARFIDRSRHRHRCISIVHGRGLHSEGNVAILRARVRQSLRQHRAVLAYADAPSSDGGAGAVYVLLRK